MRAAYNEALDWYSEALEQTFPRVLDCDSRIPHFPNAVDTKQGILPFTSIRPDSSVSVRMTGSVHDSTIYRLQIEAKKDADLGPDGHLLADSAYSAFDKVVTPICKQRRPLTPTEVKYNTAQQYNRNRVERVFGKTGMYWASIFRKYTGVGDIHLMKLAVIVFSLHNLEIMVQPHFPSELGDIQQFPNPTDWEMKACTKHFLKHWKRLKLKPIKEAHEIRDELVCIIPDRPAVMGANHLRDRHTVKEAESWKKKGVRTNHLIFYYDDGPADVRVKCAKAKETLLARAQ
eukprot:gene8240-2838_t